MTELAQAQGMEGWEEQEALEMMRALTEEQEEAEGKAAREELQEEAEQGEVQEEAELRQPTSEHTFQYMQPK